MIDRLCRDINVQIGPVEMMGRRPLDVQELCNRRTPEPREQLERQEHFSTRQQEPEALRRDVRDLNV
jgi:hypothetical protein